MMPFLGRVTIVATVAMTACGGRAESMQSEREKPHPDPRCQKARPQAVDNETPPGMDAGTCIPSCEPCHFGAGKPEKYCCSMTCNAALNSGETWCE